MHLRPLRDDERALILALAPHTDASSLDGARVTDMQDGGMGSIRFVRNGTNHCANAIAEATYTDIDGILVSIELSVDEKAQVYELDFWKVDFSPLRKYPTPGDLRFK